MDEFDLIRTYFAPLSGSGSERLEDDAAQLGDYVVTKDVLVSGVHFRPEDSLDLVAQKALRVNVSDVIAKGATPACYLLGVTWPIEADEEDIAAFASGLEKDQQAYGMTLLGGDTTRHRVAGQPLMISVTMFGRVSVAGKISRKGAQPGDIVYVTGTMGDACLGLKALEAGHTDAPSVRAYQLPDPPFVYREIITKDATASLDVSDGLLADAGHLSDVNSLRIEIKEHAIPFSGEAQNYILEKGRKGLLELISFGDDYQILFTASPKKDMAIMSSAEHLGIKVTRIGKCTEGNGIELVDEAGEPISVGETGYSHF